MIPNQWYIVLKSTEVKSKPVGFLRLGEKLVFWRDESGRAHCLRDRCVHRGASLSLGEVIEGHVRCPFHGLEFDGTGKCLVIPANSRQKPVPPGFDAIGYPVFENWGLIWIWWGEGEPDRPEPEFIEDLKSGFSWACSPDPWDNHYSRVVENQLDVSHLPFIHRKSIGRGNRTVVDGPVLEWVNPNHFKLYVYNRLENGNPPKLPTELPVKPPTAQRLEFIFPNFWMNQITDKLRVAAAFVPVDETHTLMYLMIYQKIVTLPVLSDIFNFFFMPANFRIAHEDRVVVNTQRPHASSPDGPDRLFAGDMPIVQYRRRREELKNKI